MDGLFSPPPMITGLLGAEEAERLRKQSIGTGIVSALIGGLAASPNYRYTGIAPILGQALQSGFQGMQGTYTSALENYQTQQKMLEAQRQQEQQRLREQAIASLTPEEQAIARIDPNTLGNLLVAKSKPTERKTATVGNVLVDVATGQPIYTGQQERKTTTVGNKVIDVSTGEVVYEGEKAGTIKEVDVGNKVILVDSTGKTIREIPKGVAPRAQGEVSYKTETDATGRLVYVPQRPGLPVLDKTGKPITDFKPAMTAQEVKAKERLEGPQKVVNLLEEAKGLVSGATGSYLGAGYDILGNVFGYSPEGQQSIQKLKAIETQLVLNMPRLEGPQSNFDAQLYKEAAGKIGDPTLPPEAKTAAIQTIQDINIKYGGAVAPASSAAVPAPAQANPKGNKGGLPPGVDVRKVR
jgi:hypothetical protein